MRACVCAYLYSCQATFSSYFALAYRQPASLFFVCSLSVHHQTTLVENKCLQMTIKHGWLVYRLVNFFSLSRLLKRVLTHPATPATDINLAIHACCALSMGTSRGGGGLKPLLDIVDPSLSIEIIRN